MTRFLMQSKQLSVPKEINWSELTDHVADLVDLHGLSPKALEALPYLMAGLPQTEVAKAIGVTRPTVSNWIRKYPAMQVAVEKGKEMAAEYRLSMLEGQFIKAVEVSSKLLGIDFTSRLDADGDVIEDEVINAKLATALGQHARFIIGLFVSPKKDITVTHEAGDSLFAAQKEALDYMTQQIQELDDEDGPLDVAYRIVDSNVHNEGPMVRSDGEPNFGKLGELNTDPELGTQCHDCGQWFQSLSSHIRKSLNLTLSEYELMYGLEPGSVSKTSP